MRTPYAVVFLLTMLLIGTYMYTAVEAVCKMPQTYRIGSIDERFDITEDEARLAMADAESIWEQATGNNLFTYDENGELSINFVFDERQQYAVEEVNFRDKLDVAEGVNSVIGDTYSKLVAQYKELEAQYKNRVESYERNISVYNSKVQQYNDEGGAPPSVYKELQNEKSALDVEQRSVNSLGKQLNSLATEINRLGQQGNQLVENYNDNVENYNETFGESHEFTQGDFQGDRINIYKFIDSTELTLVLAHELGHALSLNHASSETSIMYHLMGKQPATLTLTEQDLDEYERVCGRSTRSWVERLFILFNI